MAAKIVDHSPSFLEQRIRYQDYLESQQEMALAKKPDFENLFSDSKTRSR